MKVDMELRRNDPCPCGSGRKYKKCCAEAQVESGSDQLGQAAELVRRGDFLAATELFLGAEAVGHDGAAACYQLGVALKERGALEEAAEVYRQALALRPEYVEALNNLGIILKEGKEFTEAAELLQKAARLRPEAAIGHYNLGAVLVELHRVPEARHCFGRALELHPSYVEAHFNLGLLARQEGDWAGAEASFRQAVELRPDYPRAQAELAILAWMSGNFAACSACLEQISRSRLLPKDPKFVEPFSLYLGKLLAYHRDHGDLYPSGTGLPLLYAVGESHCLGPAHLQVRMRDNTYRVTARIVIGAKAWNLGRNQPNHYQRTLEKIVAAIPSGAPVLAAFGEIDCRFGEGIFKHHRKTGNDLGQAIPELVENYVAYMARLFEAGALHLMLANVPAPRLTSAAVSDEDAKLLAEVAREFNRALDASCARHNLPIVDLYGATVGPGGLAQGQFHLDTVHLEPALYKRLLEGM